MTMLFDCSFMDKDEFQASIKSLKSSGDHDNIESVVLIQNEVDDNTINSLAQAVVKLLNLKSFVLDNILVDLDAANMLAALGKLPILETLKIAISIKETIHLNNDFNFFPSLIELNLSNSSFNSEGAKYLVDFIKKAKNIKTLCLSRASIEEAGISDLIEAVCEVSCLKELDLSRISLDIKNPLALKILSIIANGMLSLTSCKTPDWKIEGESLPLSTKKDIEELQTQAIERNKLLQEIRFNIKCVSAIIFQSKYKLNGCITEDLCREFEQPTEHTLETHDVFDECKSPELSGNNNFSFPDLF